MSSINSRTAGHSALRPEAGFLISLRTAGRMASTAVLAGGLLLCGFVPVSADAAERSAKQQPTGRTPAVAARPVTLLERDWQGVQQLIASQQGKVVVVDIWTTTCPICRAEFPDFTALQKRFGSEAVCCLSVNCDYDGVPDKPPAFYQPQVREFLGTHAPIETHVMLTESFLSFLKRIDLRSTPAVLVYDREGQLVRRFDNDESRSEDDDFTMEQVSRLVAQQVKKLPRP